VGNKNEITGKVGAAPPPDAPIESAAPLQPSTLEFQQQQARSNERTLPPFAPKPMGLVSGVVAAVRSAIMPPKAEPVAPAPDPEPSRVQQLAEEFFGDEPYLPVVQQQADAAPVSPFHDPMISGDVDQLVDVLPELTAEDRLRMPAASNSETPSKGLLPSLVPDTMPDKFDGISRGGFSDVNDAQYFPLTGEELRELVCALADTLIAQVRNDLRFSLALTYPRVRAVLRLEVEGAAEDKDGGFVIEKVFAPKAGTPGGTALEIARQRANQVCFVIQAVRQEFSEDGQSDQPPDAIRDELGLSRPRKTIIQGQGGQQFMVDIPSPGTDVSALTR